MPPAADFLHSLTANPPVPSYPLCFDTLAHTCVRQKSQLLSPQSLPNTCRQNTRRSIPFVQKDPLSLVLFAPTRWKLAGLTPSFSSTAVHSFPLFVTLKPVSPLLATHTKSALGYTPSVQNLGHTRKRGFIRFILFSLHDSPESPVMTRTRPVVTPLPVGARYIVLSSFRMNRSNALTATTFQSTRLLS
jgi:hypothetical protein